MILRDKRCRSLVSLIATILVLQSNALPALAQAPQPEPQTFLRKHIHLEAADLNVLNKGEPIARMLTSSQPTEVTPFGMIRVQVPRAYFLDKYRDIESFKKGKEVLQVGRFHTPPRLEDLQALALDSSELESLRKCRSGDCAIKVSASMIERFQKEINWTAPDHSTQAMALYRRMLLDYINEYLGTGNPALMVYRDKKLPVSLSGEVASLLQVSPYLDEYLPEFRKRLAGYPKETLQNSEDFFYWSRENFGFKTVVSITHVTLYHLSQQATVIASKQIYASHYFTGSLGLAAYVDAAQPAGGAGAYLMYLNRSRVDLIGGLFSGVVRYFVKRRVLDGMDKYLRLIKERLESGYRQGAAAGKWPINH